VSDTSALGQSARLVFVSEDFWRVLSTSDDVGVEEDTPSPVFSKSNHHAIALIAMNDDSHPLL